MLDITGFLTNGILLGLKMEDHLTLLPALKLGYIFESQYMRWGITVHKHVSQTSNIEIYEKDGRVSTLIILLWNEEKYHLSHPSINLTLHGKTNLYIFIGVLEKLNIKWEINWRNSYSEVLCLALESGVQCFFNLQIRELVKIGIGNSNKET